MKCSKVSGKIAGNRQSEIRRIKWEIIYFSIHTMFEDEVTCFILKHKNNTHTLHSKIGH